MWLELELTHYNVTVQHINYFLWYLMNFSYYYEYRENIHLGVKLTPA